MQLLYHIVDAFTDRPFAGNPAAVCVLDAAAAAQLDAALMQAIAGEFNLSETAFVEPADANGRRSLRWFTPGAEVDLCGHATLAAAHVLRQVGESFPVVFVTRSGELTVDIEAAGAVEARDRSARLVMDFPANACEAATAPPGLHEALGCDPSWPALRGPVGQYWLIRAPRHADVAALEPNFSQLGAVDLDGRIGVIVTALGADLRSDDSQTRECAGDNDEQRLDFVSRFFGPWVGVDEDPVTGSAHCMIGPYWHDELGKSSMRARQISQRSGDLEVRVLGDRVHLIGSAVTVASGELELPNRA